jgi:hypothetical protein
MASESLVPNSMAHQLVICTVTFDKNPPIAAVAIEFYPIVAFERISADIFEPLLVSGRISDWNSIRASVVGASIYGICAATPQGITTSDHLYASMEHFVEHSKVLIALAVESVRKDKGWADESSPMRLIRANTGKGSILDDFVPSVD